MGQALSNRHCGRGKGKNGAMEDMLVGLVAVGLMVYLFVVLLKPDKF